MSPAYVVSVDGVGDAVEVVPDLFYFIVTNRVDRVQRSAAIRDHMAFTVDDSLKYEPFASDFGPLNLGQIYRFCKQVRYLLRLAEREDKKVYMYARDQPQNKANRAVLVGAYDILFRGATAEEAYAKLMTLAPFVPFRDASCGPSTFSLTVLDVLQGVYKGKKVGFIDFHKNDKSSFSVEYVARS